MSKHTPGPWRCEPQPGQTVGKHTYTHCVMYGDDSIADTLTEADAHLIAAAPDLLKACKAACQDLEFRGDNLTCLYKDIRAAIAKAEGAVS